MDGQDTLLSPAGIDQLRTALTSAGFTSNGIADRLGPQVTAAVARNDLRAALRATEDRDPLAAGLVERSGQGLRQGLDLEPYGGSWWVLADLPAGVRPGRLAADHVLGMRWSEEVDPLVLALVGGCDGRLPLRDQIALLAVAHEVPESDLAEAAGPIVAHLIERAVIVPQEG